jgi:putative restriction endonuclease
MLSPVVVARLEKAASDNGFDLERPRIGDWLAFESTQTALSVWLTTIAESSFLAAVSRADVLEALADVPSQATNQLPAGAVGACRIDNIPELHRLLRRAFQLSRTLPDELLRVFQRQTEALPRATEADRLVVQRVGQDIFRRGLLEYWDGCCVVTGLAVPEVLRASHIKPWADCKSDAERLDVFNGLLFAPQLDAVFDTGFITVAEDGALVISDALSSEARALLALDRPLKIRALHRKHERYLPWHRSKVFRS